MPTPLQRLQARLVDSIKRHAIGLSLSSPTAEAWMLTGYLWSEECAEGLALARSVAARGPSWLGRLLEHQLADEGRHAALLRARLADLGGAPEDPSSVAGALGRLKLKRLEWLCEDASPRFARGAVVPLLACAARLEATGVRIFGRHLDVLEERGRQDETTRVLRAILDDERRHARSCAAALERLVEPGERAALAELQEGIARIDRSFGVTSSLALWTVIAAQRVGDCLVGSVLTGAPDAERRVRSPTPEPRRPGDSLVDRGLGAATGSVSEPGSEAPSAGAA